jgi:hypothetical protein
MSLETISNGILAGMLSELARKKNPHSDIPVLAIVQDGKRTFCAPTHRLGRGWQGVKPPAQIIRWAPMPKPPTVENQ